MDIMTLKCAACGHESEKKDWKGLVYYERFYSGLLFKKETKIEFTFFICPNCCTLRTENNNPLKRVTE